MEPLDSAASAPLDSFAANVEFALFQLSAAGPFDDATARLSALEILREALAEARGEPLQLH